jgi:hypothetical protein
MEQVAKDIWFIFRVVCLFGGAAAAITFCVASVCQWMAWSPVNITVNVNQYGVDFEPGSDVGQSGETKT